jgi:hypothetical protein
MRRRDDGDDDSLPDAVDGERCPRPQRYLLRPDFRTLFDKTSLPICPGDRYPYPICIPAVRRDRRVDKLRASQPSRLPSDDRASGGHPAPWPRVNA